jgi:two-component system cell cycle response regulator DivK
MPNISGTADTLCAADRMASNAGALVALGVNMSNRILVVEDNEPDRELLRDWLEEDGMEVDCATTLEQAFARFQCQVPGLVLLDVQLGSQEGLALIEWMRRDPNLRDLPVIAVTAHALVTDYDRVMRAGCCACVSKPVNFGLLREYLRRWLKNAATA